MQAWPAVKGCDSSQAPVQDSSFGAGQNDRLHVKDSVCDSVQSEHKSKPREANRGRKSFMWSQTGRFKSTSHVCFMLFINSHLFHFIACIVSPGVAVQRWYKALLCITSFVFIWKELDPEFVFFPAALHRSVPYILALSNSQRVLLPLLCLMEF